MKLNEIYQIADKIAPKKLSDAYCAAYGAYDNSGVLIDTGDEVTGVLFSLDLSFAAIDAAEKAGTNLIITHHPAMYGKLNHARAEADDLVERKLVKCLRKGISVLSMHLNLDTAEGGIDESLQMGVCLAANEDMTEKEWEKTLQATQKMHVFDGGAYGRVYDVSQTSLKALQTGIERRFSTARAVVYGQERKIGRAASFCGAGADDEAVRFALKCGADVIISSDFKHHVLTYAVESGLSVIILTHYASENYGFKKYYEKIRRQTELPCVYHEDADLL